MAYRRHTDFYIPVLKVLDDLNEHEVNSLISDTANRCGLSEEERKERTRKGTQLKYESNIQWAITDLCQGAFIERVSRGVYKMTYDGLLMLEDNPANPTRDYLESRSEKFKEFRYRKGSRNKGQKSDDNLFTNLAEEDIENEEESTQQVSAVSSDKLVADAEEMLAKCYGARELMIAAELDTTQVDNKIRLLKEGILKHAMTREIEGFLDKLKSKSIPQCRIIIDYNNAKNIEVYASISDSSINPIPESYSKILSIEETYEKREEEEKSDELKRKKAQFDNKIKEKNLKNKKQKAPRQGLRVIFADGQVIEEKYAADVFAKAIEKIGPQRIIPLGLSLYGYPLVGRKAPEKYQYKELDGGFFIPVNSPTQIKKSLLETIALELGINLKVEILS